MITEVRTSRAQRRAARQSRVQHLVTADEQSLAELEAFLATLPLCATGRVFIEVPDTESISHVDAPARMTVTWLARSRRSGSPAPGRPAVAAWPWHVPPAPGPMRCSATRRVPRRR
ncbi:SIP domain-containing protein [Microbacterium sp. NIBRBAC000506063]|uniref:SIP domain-containing protein n=1 Tax=Microbacterium sp. NIBRBAC000506063 TaxID=2734618 RepID=UPI002948C150|nr:SIP domain-containing protein [Microbacterium sp. NIBRBAC000506063]